MRRFAFAAIRYYLKFTVMGLDCECIAFYNLLTELLKRGGIFRDSRGGSQAPESPPKEKMRGIDTYSIGETEGQFGDRRDERDTAKRHSEILRRMQKKRML
jgi:hypothetical protein